MAPRSLNLASLSGFTRAAAVGRLDLGRESCNIRFMKVARTYLWAVATALGMYAQRRG